MWRKSRRYAQRGDCLVVLIDISKYIFSNSTLNRSLSLCQATKRISPHQKQLKVVWILFLFILNNNKIIAISLAKFNDLETQLKRQIERNQRLIKEFERKSFEILRAFRNLIGFKIKFCDKKIKLICETRPECFLLFRVGFL